MDKREVNTDTAPKALGPYSQAVAAGNWVFLSCQLGIDPDKNQLVTGGLEAETVQVFANIKAVLEEAGIGFNHVVKATVFLKDMANFKSVNTIYADFFSPPYPARTAIAVKELPLSAEIGIEILAVR